MQGKMGEGEMEDDRSMVKEVEGSSDLGCVGAKRIMFLGRFLVWPTYLLPCEPRPARV